MSARNGSPDVEQAEKMRDRQQERQAANQGLQVASQMADDLQQEKADYVETILESELSTLEKDMLNNFVSKDFALANYEPQQIRRIFWRLQIVVDLKFKAMHPAEDNIIQGADEMEFYYGIDSTKTPTEPLTPDDKVALEGLSEGVYSLVTRGEGMEQQEQLNKSITRSEVDRVSGDRDESGGLRGRIFG